jgi:FMN phosphatase YigB (HAD superfamily)
MGHVAFDIGNVLCHFDINIFLKELVKITNINDHDAYFFVEHIQRMQDMGVSSIAHGLEYRFKLSGDELQYLLQAWNKTITPNDMMLNFVDKLKSDGVKIALLSNMGPEHISYLRSSYPQIFEGTTQHISCEVGARKPQKLFFQSFCLDHDEFSGCVYIDDLEENLRVGKKYGFKGYNFNLEETLKFSQGKQKIELDKLRTMIYNK